jgi:hypothetical protein
MLVVRVTENLRAVQSSYYSSCPCVQLQHMKNLAGYSTLAGYEEFTQIRIQAASS